MTQDKGTGFELRADASGETALIVDGRCGFSQALPGHPALAPVVADGGPRHEARVLLGDAAIAVRYRLDRLPAGMQAAPLAQSLTLAYARNRTTAPPRVSLADARQCQAWGVVAAASSVYALAQPGADGDHESVTVLARPAGDGLAAMVVTYRFAAAAVSPATWALFVSAASAGIRWGAEDVPRLWPESSYLQPGIRGEPTPARRAGLDGLRGRLAVAPGEREQLRQRLMALVGGSEAPASRVDDHQLETYASYLADVVADGPTGAAIRAALGDVRVAHDLRGAALLLLAAF